MKYLFNGEICGWDSWGRIFQSVEAWEKLVNFIFKRESLPVSKIENLAPGTNAVFKSGKYIVKIFAPKESGQDGYKDYKSEIFALSFAQSLGILVSNLVAGGVINDKYCFSYMVTEYIDGVDFHEASAKFTNDEKVSFAKRMRQITDTLNVPCRIFNGIDVVHDKSRHKRWDKYSQKFKMERLEYLNNHDFGKRVFVHGDLCYDNLLIDKNGNIYIIDFADSVIAPRSYEHAHLASVLFNFDKPYLRGYFGDYKTDALACLCFDGLLIHDFGGDIVGESIAAPDEITCLQDLKCKLYELTS